MLSLVATAFGIVVAYFGVALFNRAITVTNVPFFIDIRLHPPVLLFTIGVAIVTTLFAGAIPAYQSSRADINEILKDEARGASSFRVGRISKALVVFEIALSCGLLVAAGLMIKSVTNDEYDGQGILDDERVHGAHRLSRRRTPTRWPSGASSIRSWSVCPRCPACRPRRSAADSRPPDPGFNGTNFAMDGQTYLKDKDYPSRDSLSVTPKFFATLGTPLSSGRVFNEADRDGALPVVLVNRAFVAKYFKNADPIGKRVRLGGSKSKAQWSTIVGVVGDMFSGDQQEPMPPAIFQPFAQARSTFVYISARTSGPPMAITQGVRDAVNSLNPDIPLYWVSSLDDAVAQSLWFVRVFGTMFMIFGFVALFLASVGLYAVMSFSVSRRTREVGIRMALGAQGGDVVRMIFGQGLLQLAVGMTVGLALGPRHLAAAQGRALSGPAARSGHLRRRGRRARGRGPVRLLRAGQAGDAGRSAGRVCEAIESVTLRPMDRR